MLSSHQNGLATLCAGLHGDVMKYFMVVLIYNTLFWGPVVDLSHVQVKVAQSHFSLSGLLLSIKELT